MYGVCVAWVLTVINWVLFYSEEVGFNPLERKGVQAALAQADIRPSTRGLEKKGKFPKDQRENSAAAQEINELATTSHGHEDLLADTQWAGQEIHINLAISTVSELVLESFPN